MCIPCRGTPKECGRHLYRGFAMPPGIAFLSNASCSINGDLGRSGATLPVTHMRAGVTWGLGLFFYYAMGCSDFGWSMGRTLLVLNRYDLALKLLLRRDSLVSNVGERGYFVQHASDDLSSKGLGSAHTMAAKRVAAALARRNPKWAQDVMMRAHHSGHPHVRRYYGSPSNATLASVIADAAHGIMQPDRCNVRNPAPNGEACLGDCDIRSRAVTTVLAHHDARAVDVYNAFLLRELCGTALQLDTAQLLHQPAGVNIKGAAFWATEIWDVRTLCSAKLSRRDGVVESQTESSRWANGSACTPSPPAEWNHCFACNQSELQQRCVG